MKMRKLGFDGALGLVSLVIGIVCLYECARLFPMRSSVLAGDHALAGLTGLAMLGLGVLLIIRSNARPIRAVYPGKAVVVRLMAILGILVFYAISLKYLGYILPTLLFGIPLFRLFGGYAWRKCLAVSALSTAGLYLVFVLGLGMSFPRGLFL